MKDLTPQQAHRDYVSGALFYYQQNDIQPGDPNEGDWEEAHYPKPKRLGGTETIWLLKQHHAIQGVLQSEEYQCCCVSGLYMKYVRGTEYEERMSWWLGEQLRKLNAEPWTDERRTRAGARLKGKTAPLFTPEHRAKLSDVQRKKCVVTDLKTGKRNEFRSQQEAAAFIGCVAGIVSNNLKNNKPIFGRYIVERS